MKNPGGPSRSGQPVKKHAETVPLSHEALRESHNLSKMGVLSVDTHGRITYANPAALLSLDMALDHVLRKPWSKLLEDTSPGKSNTFKLDEQKEITDQEFRVITPAREYWVLISSLVHRDSKGKTETYLFARDITRLKKKENLTAYLSEAAADLAQTRDTQSALQQIAQLIVPRFANWFTIDQIKDNKLELLVLKHADPGKVEWAYEYRKKYPADLDGNVGAAIVVKSGKPGFVPVITPQMIDLTVPDPVQREEVKKIGLHSVIMMPMTNREKITGLVNFISSDPNRHFDETDLEFAQNFAALIGLALENTRLNEEAANELKLRKQSAEQLRFLTDAIPHKIWTSGPDGRATYYNRQWHDFTGVEGFEELREQIWGFIHPEDRKIAEVEWPWAIESGTPMELEQRFKRHDGTYRWHLTRFIPFKNDRGEVELWVGTSTDINEQKSFEIEIASANEELRSANEELASANEEMVATNEELTDAQEMLQEMVKNFEQSETRLRDLIKYAPVGIAIYRGREMIVDLVNEGMLKIWGKRASVTGKPLAVALPELVTEGQPFLQLILDVLDSGQVYHGFEARALLRHGDEMKEGFFDFIFQPLRDDDGKVVSVLQVATDVTQRVVARRQLQQTEETLLLAVGAARIGILQFEPKSKYLHYNEMVAGLLGYHAPQEMTFDDILARIPDEHKQYVLHTIRDAARNKQKYDITFPLHRFDDDKLIWLRSMGKITTDGENNQAVFSGVVIDATEQKRDEIRKNDFIGMVSHELKTPLTSLTSIVQLLNIKLKESTDPYISTDPFISMAGTKAEKQVKRMAAMINGFLNISRLESGKIQVIKTRLELAELLEDVIQETELTTSTHQVRFHPGGQVWIDADRDKISSVISNLLSNSIKYSQRGTEIDVNYKQTPTEAIVSVTDKGIGIKQEDTAKLFERYSRVETEVTMHISGFGIGLYLCREILELHGGRIWVESEFGQGSTFYFSLPLSD